MPDDSSLGVRDRRPLTVQVRDALRKTLQDGAYGPGMRLPTESQLADQFAVGRTTIREALKALEQEGLIEVQRGLGRFVSAAAGLKIQRPITRYETVNDRLAALGYAVTTRVL